MTTKANILTVGNFVILSVSCLAMGFVFARISSHSGNHVGGDPRVLWALYTVAIVVGAVQVWKNEKFSGLPAWLVVIGVFGLASGVAIDRFNILIDKVGWFRRGFPPRPF